MKVLLVGDWHSQIHEESLYRAFLKIGHNVHKFSWHQYFSVPSGKSFRCMMSHAIRRFQNKFIIGPIIKKINEDILKEIETIKPEFVFIYRGTHVFPETLQTIKEEYPDIAIVGYNNDNPFTDTSLGFYWRHYLKSLPSYDWIFAYRQKNVLDYKDLGFENVSLLRSFYVRERHYILSELPTSKYNADVTFIGHYEDDERDTYIKTILDSGINFRLFGPLWECSKHYKYILDKLGKIDYLNDNYNIVVNSTKIALVFLSRLNNDTYTRRCFEIPATATFMLSQYTDDLDSMFKEGVEAEYFRDKEEMLSKIRFYLKHEKKRKDIALAGYRRIMRDGHEVTDRVREILKVYYRLQQ